MMHTFSEVFGYENQTFSEAHGRVNLIGEHTDYNNGFVLPTCLPHSARVFLRSRNDHLVKFYSTNSSTNKDGSFHEYALGSEEKRNHWTDYFLGATWLLRKKGYHIYGFDCLLNSNVPLGSGLSSSAALEVSLLKGINKLFQLKIDDLTIARYAQEVENEFVGAHVGIMDQMAASIGQVGEALFIDTETLKYQQIPLVFDGAELLVINSGVTHSNVHGGYNQRRRECESACRILHIPSLRQADKSLIENASLPAMERKRARHVVCENARVLAAVAALRQSNHILLGQLFRESQASMRDDYEISIPEIDLLINLTENTDGLCYGARLTGAGFGGSIVAIVKKGSVHRIMEKVLPIYRNQTGRIASIVMPI